MGNLLQNSTEISIQGLVAIIALVSAVVSALVSGVMQIITKILENRSLKEQMEITNEHELRMVKEKNLQEMRIKKWDTYYAEEKETFRQFIHFASLFLNDPDGDDSKENYINMMKYRNLALLYGDDAYKEKDKLFFRYGGEIEAFRRYASSAKSDLEPMIKEINRILRSDIEM